MKAILMSLLLVLPLAAAADDANGVDLKLSYGGAGQFTYGKKGYDYAGLLQVIRAEHGGQHILTITVDMGDDINLADRLKVCHLKLDTGAQVMMTFEINGQQNTLYCT